jgi:hypothetical protein
VKQSELNAMHQFALTIGIPVVHLIGALARKTDPGITEDPEVFLAVCAHVIAGLIVTAETLDPAFLSLVERAVGEMRETKPAAPKQEQETLS